MLRFQRPERRIFDRLHDGLVARAVTAALLITAGATVPISAGDDPPAAKPRLSRDLEINGHDVWTVTDLRLAPGERAVFTAGGAATCVGEPGEVGPNGLARGFRDLLRALPVNEAGRGALVGRIGEQEIAPPFLIGTARDIVTAAGGLLALGINRSESEACDAAYSVHVDIFPPPKGVRLAIARDVPAIDGVDAALFSKVPRRVEDAAGNLGDMVNFLILGPEVAVRRAFEAAGWVTVDADAKRAMIAAVIESLSREAYLTMPMSQLYLFRRPQDFGWAHAEPVQVVASRHHLRMWRAPFQAAGSIVWVGAATHDIGFERDRRNNGVTHKIDPDVDLERDYVQKTLSATGLVGAVAHVLPDKPLREAKTATGGSFHSDGRVLILKLDAAAEQATAR